LPIATGHVDDARSSGAAQIRQQRLSNFEGAEGVCLKRLDHTLARNCCNRQSLVGVNAGVINKHIQTIGNIGEPVGGLADAVGITYVE
jgi:hypothetical protein